MQNNIFENITKEQAFQLGMLFSYLHTNNLIIPIDSTLENQSKQVIEGIAKDIDMSDIDLQFFFDFKNKSMKRDDLARKYGYCTSNIYPRYKAIRKRLERAFKPL